jgi:sugar O-acyltransferase (sialic acid O-acetyltransferase NeuD family)
VQDVIIFGTHGFASEVQQIVDDLAGAGEALRCIGFMVDPAYRTESVVRGLPVFDDIPKSSSNFLIGVGQTKARQRIAQEIESRFQGRFLTLKHPRASVGSRVTIGTGSILCPGACAIADIVIGRHVQLHAGCTVGHDTVIGDFVTVAPGANVSGRVRLGEGVFVGAGAVVLPDIEIGAWAMIGAGAVVTKNVPARATVVGVPARVLPRRISED